MDPQPTVSKWAKVGKEWHDLYHPNIYRPRDHSKHSKKKKK